MERILELVEDVQELSWEQIQWSIQHACRVNQLSFKVWTILLTACAVLSSITRLLIRYLRERKLFLEDCLILFATICLIVETGLVYSFIKSMYLIDAVTFRLPVLSYLVHSTTGSSAYDLLMDFFTVRTGILDAYFTFGWLAIFAIKASFLALFSKMLRNVTKKLRAWFWVTVAATGTSALIVILEGFVMCPQFGAGPVQCFVKNEYTFSVSSGVVVQSLDIVTDLMIVSIPILLLHMSHLRLQHKLRLAMVLCLSTACIILSIIRMAGGISLNVFEKSQFSVTWVSFMLHCEAAVAIMAGSVPALHVLFTSYNPKPRRRMILSMTEDETIKEKASRVLGRLTYHESTESGLAVPGLVHDRARVVSITKWRYSLVGAIPRRTGSHRSKRLTFINHDRKGSADSGLIHPGVAYHTFRKQEKERERNLPKRKEIKVTYETTVSSQSASKKSLEMAEATSPTGTIISAPGSPKHYQSYMIPEPVVTARGMDVFVDQHFGRIHAGMRM